MQEMLLLINKLNQCVFCLNGVSFDVLCLVCIFVGFGVVGGMIFGKEIQFDGVFGQVVVFDMKFLYYLFIGFLLIEIDIMKVVGMYSYIGFGEVLLQKFVLVLIDVKVMINVDGMWIKCDMMGQFVGGVCVQ